MGHIVNRTRPVPQCTYYYAVPAYSSISTVDQRGDMQRGHTRCSLKSEVLTVDVEASAVSHSGLLNPPPPPRASFPNP